MTDLDELRAALREPPDYAPRPVDLDAVQAAGTRIRRRRRTMAGAAAGLTVAAVLVGGSQIVPWTPRPGTDAAAPKPGPNASAEAPDTGVPAPPGPVDDLVRTGLPADGGGEWVIYRQPVTELPGIEFGFMLGRQAGDGTIEPVVMANETEGDELAPGFHAVSAAMNVNGRDTPAFGYYVGPATRITAKVGARTKTAELAPWSRNGSVKLFWIAEFGVQKVAAYDADGKKLPDGNAGVTVG